jgi:hypothetical protein
VAAKVVDGTSFRGITLLPIDSSSQSKLIDICSQLWSIFLRPRGDIAIAFPASARATFAFGFGLITLHTADSGGVRLQVRSYVRLLVVFAYLQVMQPVLTFGLPRRLCLIGRLEESPLFVLAGDCGLPCSREIWTFPAGTVMVEVEVLGRAIGDKITRRGQWSPRLQALGNDERPSRRKSL